MAMKEKMPCMLFGLIMMALVFPALTSTIRAETVYVVPPASSSANQMKLNTVSWHGATISKPSCPATSPYPQIYVYPVHMLGYGTGGYLYGIAGVNAYAADYGTYWQVLAEMKTLDTNYYADDTHIRVLVQVWCCKNTDCNDY